MLAAKRGADFELGYWNIQTNKQTAGERGEKSVLKNGEKASLQLPHNMEKTFFNPLELHMIFNH